MLVLSKPYTDRHGITFAKAVLVVTAINYAVSNSGSFIVDVTDPQNVDYKKVNQNESLSVGFTASLYASAEAFTASKEGMVFRDKNGSEYISLSLPADTPIASLLAKCEEKLLEMVSE